MSQNFSKAKIYKITNDYNDDVYVGSTCNTLVKRFCQHKGDAPKEDRTHLPLNNLINEIGFNRFRIELIEDYPCKDKYELNQRQGFYIRQFGSLNHNVKGRNKEEYSKTEQARYLQKESRERNKESRIEYDKEYYEQNKETIAEKRKKYIETNKNKIQEYIKEKITCECGCLISRCSITKHKKSQTHIELLNAKSSETTN